jgi:C4-dicarboxylate-specific signal transduction histidine kinase
LPYASPLKKWDKVFLWLLFALPVLAVIDITLIAHAVSKWIGHVIILCIIGAAYLLPDFRFLRNTVWAVLPFVLVSFIKDMLGLVNTTFANKIEIYLDILYPCTIVWMIAMFFISNKQRKVLQQEREKREKEEEQNRIIAARKAELEVLVAERTAELTYQKDELQQALIELKSTQAQLLQSEKMASLGELTAGIAHEIQNPLNFVNNFSEVNKELIEELEQEADKGNIAEVKAIVNGIKENEQKINHHGKRADAIVKGMLLHSRTSSGKKEPTDINALADEYLRLSYHGLRAKDKTFNAKFEIHFDESIGKINVVPQDIGRVLLNLFNNAFYAVNEKKKQLNGPYEPVVEVSTKKVGNKVALTVKDNGNGIPLNIVDKIFQPFFTTKPTGDGTGLGLSLSYDITRAHGGEIKVETKEGEGTAFIIYL